MEATVGKQIYTYGHQINMLLAALPGVALAFTIAGILTFAYARITENRKIRRLGERAKIIPDAWFGKSLRRPPSLGPRSDYTLLSGRYRRDAGDFRVCEETSG
jgi:hypothetical protein